MFRVLVCCIQVQKEYDPVKKNPVCMQVQMRKDQRSQLLVPTVIDRNSVLLTSCKYFNSVGTYLYKEGDTNAEVF